MNILTDSPLLIENPLDEQAKNVAIGQSFASSFLSGFNRGIERKREDERWAELKPLRDAQLAAQQAQADAAKSQVQLQAIQLAKEAMMKEKMAEFAALDAEMAFQGYTPEARVNMLGWMEKNSEFYGSRFHAELEQKFTKAAMAADDKERTLAEIAQNNARLGLERDKLKQDKELTEAGIRSRENVALIREAGSPQEEILSSDELATLRARENTAIRVLFNNAALAAQPEKLSQAVREVQKSYDALRVSMREEKSKRLGLSGQKAGTAGGQTEGEGELVLDIVDPATGKVGVRGQTTKAPGAQNPPPPPPAQDPVINGETLVDPRPQMRVSEVQKALDDVNKQLQDALKGYKGAQNTPQAQRSGIGTGGLGGVTPWSTRTADEVRVEERQKAIDLQRTVKSLEEQLNRIKSQLGTQ